MIESLYFEHDELTPSQTLQFDEIIAVLKQFVLESSKNGSMYKEVRPDTVSSHHTELKRQIQQKKLNYLFNPENF